jgi:predicted nucleic acid-binding Zn ribbon protein
VAEPRRLGEILRASVARLGAGDLAQAYALWAQACGPQVGGVTCPRRFARGLLTVECESSVWSSELTLLGGAILAKMTAIDAEQPVKKLRFVVGTPRSSQGDPAPAAKPEEPWRKLATGETDEASSLAEGLSDEKLRAAVRVALAAALDDPAPPGR